MYPSGTSLNHCRVVLVRVPVSFFHRTTSDPPEMIIQARNAFKWLSGSSRQKRELSSTWWSGVESILPWSTAKKAGGCLLRICLGNVLKHCVVSTDAWLFVIPHQFSAGPHLPELPPPHLLELSPPSSFLEASTSSMRRSWLARVSSRWPSCSIRASSLW